MNSVVAAIPPRRVAAQGQNSARYVEKRFACTAAVMARTK
jgi:hypothetical protein